MTAFKVGDRVNYPASADHSHQAGRGRVAAVFPFNDGTGYVYAIQEGGLMGALIHVAFKEAELSSVSRSEMEQEA